MFLLEMRSALEVGVSVDDSRGEEKCQDTEAAGGGHVSPHTVGQLHYRAEAHGRQHLQEIRLHLDYLFRSKQFTPYCMYCI